MGGEELLVVDVEPDDDALYGGLEVRTFEKGTELGAMKLANVKCKA